MGKFCWSRVDVIMRSPRELTPEECQKFKLTPDIKPVIECSTVVFAAAATETDPIYRMYYWGTNGFKILRYSWKDDKWEQISYTEIDNLYSFIWLLCDKLGRLGAAK